MRVHSHARHGFLARVVKGKGLLLTAAGNRLAGPIADLETAVRRKSGASKTPPAPVPILPCVRGGRLRLRATPKPVPPATRQERFPVGTPSINGLGRERIGT